jgi:catechol 2,3-dioxygenase-like lactoylglutathione lyase family enzyme
VAITLNHTIVPARDKVASAEFFARIFGLNFEGTQGHFAPVRVNGDLTMDFDNWDTFESHHYAFLIGDNEFDGIFGRIQAEGIEYAAGPSMEAKGQINHRRDGRGFYFRDPDGHLLEVMTRP